MPRHNAEPWDDPRITAFGMLLEAHAAVMSAVGRGVEGDRVPVVWFEVMLRLARSEGHQMRMGELAGQVGLSTSGLTRLIDRMEEAGYVRRETCPTDRRGAWSVLTDKAEAFLRSELPSHLERIKAALVTPLGDQLDTFTDLLRVVRDANGPGNCPGPAC